MVPMSNSRRQGSTPMSKSPLRKNPRQVNFPWVARPPNHPTLELNIRGHSIRTVNEFVCCVLSHSQLHQRWCRGHVPATIQTAGSYSRVVGYTLLTAVPETNIMNLAISETLASESKVMPGTRTKWLVYIWESFAPPESLHHICLTCKHRRICFRTKRIRQDSHFNCFGYWKNAVQEEFNFEIKHFNLTKTSSSPIMTFYLTWQNIA